MSKRNKLTFSQMMKVSQWLTDNREQIELQRLSKTEAARRASEDLGFDVTYSNIHYFATGDNDLGIQWKMVKPQEPTDERDDIDLILVALSYLVHVDSVPDHVFTQVSNAAARAQARRSFYDHY